MEFPNEHEDYEETLCLCKKFGACAADTSRLRNKQKHSASAGAPQRLTSECSAVAETAPSQQTQSVFAELTQCLCGTCTACAAETRLAQQRCNICAAAAALVQQRHTATREQCVPGWALLATQFAKVDRKVTDEICRQQQC